MLANATRIRTDGTQNDAAEPAPVVLDVRNSYEWDAGHFEGAERPREEEFRETPCAPDDPDAVPAPLRGVSPGTPVMVRRLRAVSHERRFLLWASLIACLGLRRRCR